MQNKHNLLDARMNISSVLTKYYKNQRLRRRAGNKPNQTQFTKYTKKHEKTSKNTKKCEKTTRFLPLFYGSTISRMRFRPYKPAFYPKSTPKTQFSNFRQFITFILVLISIIFSFSKVLQTQLGIYLESLPHRH